MLIELAELIIEQVIVDFEVRRYSHRAAFVNPAEVTAVTGTGALEGDTGATVWLYDSCPVCDVWIGDRRLRVLGAASAIAFDVNAALKSAEERG